MAVARRRDPDLPDIRRLREDLGISRERMARLLDVSAKTIERWEAAGSLPAAAAQLRRVGHLQEIVDLGRVVYTPDGLRRFLTAPLSEFAGRTALQLIELGQSDRVVSALAADYEGAGF